MKAVVISQAGGPEVLHVDERPVPSSGPGEVLIRVYAAGINRPDVAQRKGHYPPPPGASPDIPGLEVAGIIEACPNSGRWKVGDKVCALIAGGGYAEYVTAPEGQCLPIPANISMVEAASLPETFFTVWHNVMERGRLQPNESLLVHGGSSGIGVTAIQIAIAWGSNVFVTAGTDEKCQFCESLGAKAVNYKSNDFAKVIQEQGGGIDVILDMIGAAYFESNISLLNPEGRLVLINHMKGEEASVKLGTIMRRRLTITGSTLRARDVAFKSALASRLEQTVWPWFEQRRIRPIVFRTFPLERASEAHRVLESGVHIGKLVLTVSA